MKIIAGFLFLAALGSAGVIWFKPAPPQPPGEDPRFATRLYDPKETDWNDYIWPTDASTVKTSSFCEFRKSHFHAGIDVSTNMKTGYRVFAVRDGSIHSIEFEPGGYGWFLVLRHNDGYFSAYAHLDGFPDWVEKAYWAKLAERNKSFGYAEWKPGEITVKKGMVVAFTGATGAGPPHLHFEIRDRDFNPVNPGLAPKLRVPDTRPPVFQQIALVPLDGLSAVNGKSEPYYVQARKVSDSLYVVTETPALTGRIGLQVRASDGAEGFQDVETPYSMTMTVNGKKHFNVSFDRIQNNHEWFIRLDRNNELMQEGKGEFRKLYREPGNSLSVYLPNEPWAGILTSAVCMPGTVNTITVRAEDLSRNQSILRFSSTYEPSCRLRLTSLSSQVVQLAVTDAGEFQTVVCERIAGKRATVVKQWKASELTSPVRWILPDTVSEYTFKVRLGKNAVLQTLYLSPASSAPESVNGSYTVSCKGILVHIKSSTPFDTPPEIRLVSANGTVTAFPDARNAREYEAAIVVDDQYPQPFIIEVSSAKKRILWRDTIRETYISSANGGTLWSGDRTCSVTFEPGSIPVSSFFTLQSLPGAAPGVRLLPGGAPLSGAVSVRMKPTGVHDGKNFIRAIHPLISLRYGTKRFDPASPWVEGTFKRYPAEYRMERDTTPPRISTTMSKGRGLQFTIQDIGAGANLQTLLVRSGKTVVPVYYSEEANAFHIPQSYVKSAKPKTLTISVNDRAGNYSVIEVAR